MGVDSLEMGVALDHVTRAPALLRHRKHDRREGGAGIIIRFFFFFFIK